VGIRYAYAEVFMGDWSDPKVSIQDRHYAESDMQLAPEHTGDQLSRGVGAQPELRKVSAGGALTLEKWEDLFMDIEGVSDTKRSPVLDRRVESTVKPALYMLQRPSYLPDSGPALIREFKAGKIPVKKFDTPVLLKSLYFPADIGVAGMETLGGSNEISFFRENKSAHKSLSGNMGEHASPETSPNIGGLCRSPPRTRSAYC